MIYLELFWAFLKVGLFSFGGAYSAIPLIREAVLSRGWMDTDMLANMIAVSESTPGPLMVNMATYVGSTEGGVLGALVATFAVVLPAFALILLIMVVLKKLLERPAFRAVLDGLKPCVMGIILATGVYMIAEHILSPGEGGGFDIRAAGITLFLLLIRFGLPHVHVGKKKIKISPILLIVISAGMGILVYGLWP